MLKKSLNQSPKSAELSSAKAAWPSAIERRRLQRSIGNENATHLTDENDQSSDAASIYDAPGFGRDFSHIPSRTSAEKPGRIQFKLKISDPDDKYEQEADRVAEQVMRMPEPQVQGACPCGGGCPKCQTESQAHARLSLQTNHVESGALGLTEVPPSVLDGLCSPGHPLDTATRASMEPCFGHDFSGVRVHSNPIAEHSARQINARAYTVGQSIVFGSGQFAPSTHEGRRLLAHELTHVVQQGGNASSRRDRLIAQPLVRMGALQRQTDDEKERERGGQPVTGVRLCHRVFDLPDPLWLSVPARHCYVAAVTKSGSVDKALTATFDPKHSGTPDAAPTKLDWHCGVPYPVSFETVKSKYKELCDPAAFQLGANNCCSCAERALKASGIKPRPGDFPATNLGTGLDPSEHSKGWKSEALGLFTAAPMGDTEIRSFVAGKTTAELSAIPLEGKKRLIDRLLRGWVSDEDLDAIERIFMSSSEPDTGRLRDIYSPRDIELTDFGQRLRFRSIIGESRR